MLTRLVVTGLALAMAPLAIAQEAPVEPSEPVVIFGSCWMTWARSS